MTHAPAPAVIPENAQRLSGISISNKVQFYIDKFEGDPGSPLRCVRDDDKGHYFFLPLCASSTDEINAQSVSPVTYQDYSCRQIAQELAAVQRKASEVGAVFDDQASTDKVQTGLGIMLLWPTLFFLDGDTPQAAEYARLKGEADALDAAARQKSCNAPVVEETKTTRTTTVVKKKK